VSAAQIRVWQYNCGTFPSTRPPSPMPIPRWLSLVVLAIALAQVARIGALRPIRRELAKAPLIALTGVLALLIGAALLVRWPWLVDVAAAAAAVALLASWWRARPSYGSARGLPPGSLGIRASVAAVDDRDFYRDQGLRFGPVFKMSQFGRPVVCVIGLGRGREILRGQPESLAGAPLPYNRFLPRGMLRYMTAEDHRHDGAVFRAAFSDLGFVEAEDLARATCRRMFAALSTESRRHPVGAHPKEACVRWAAEALARLLFGIDPDDPRFPTLERARRVIDIDRSGGPGWRARTEAAFQSAEGVLRELGARPGSALGGLVAVDHDALGDQTRIRNLFLTWRLGATDLAALLDWLLAQLAAHPGWLDAVRRAPRVHGPPAGAQPSDIASRVVLETLRLEQSEFLYRRIIRPLAIDSYRIPAGWLLRICVQESHRDPATFTDPDRFDPDRFLGRTYGRTEFAPFGLDTHGCLGVGLVQFLGRIFVEELSHGYRVRVTRDGPLDHGSRHRHHWHPSPERRLVLDPLAPA